MALGAVLAAALTDHSARPFMLTVAGLDVLKQPGGGYGSPIEMIKLTQRGPGGISELTFVVEDAAAVVGFNKGDWVQFRDITNDYILFSGFVVGWKPRPWQPAGRTVEVRCAGVEVVLDWMKVNAFTVTQSTPLGFAIQQAVGNAIGVGVPLRAFLRIGGPANGEQANPITPSLVVFTDTSADLAIPAGTTLREAIRRICDSTSVYGSAAGWSGILVTVDYTLGLRVFPDLNAGVPQIPSDWGAFSVTTTGAGEAAANMDYAIDARGPSSVLVIGASGTLEVGGDGSPGEAATLSDSSLTTASQMLAAGIGYLSQYQQKARGSLTVEDKALATSVFPGSTVTITAPEFNLSAVSFRASEISRTFYGTKQDWTITFGGLSASFASLLRRLSRDTLS